MHKIVTISREFGSGGRELGKRLAEELGIPCYDHQIIEMIAKEKSPFWVTLDGRKIEHFLNRRKFDEAAEGWYYSQTKKAVEVKYANPGKDYNLTVSFEQFDLIGM